MRFTVCEQPARGFRGTRCRVGVVARAWLSWLWILAACGGGNPVAPDGPAPDAPPDTTLTFPACHEFETIGFTVPVHHAGVLDGADVTTPSSCATTDAPYGLASAGPDSVMLISGLVPEQTYV